MSIEEIKQLATKIIEEESIRINEPINTYIVTLKEYCNRYMLKKNNLKNIIKHIRSSIHSGAFNDQKGNIVIFLDKINKIEPLERKMFILILYCYHETRHTEQNIINKYSYIRFCSDIEEYLIGEKRINYNQEHNNLFIEIDANIHAINKTKEYLKKEYPNIYEKELEEIEKLEQAYLENYIKYDLVDTIDKLIELLKFKLNIHFAEFVQSMDIISPVLDIFLNSDLSFKPIKTIIQDKRIKELDTKIFYAFLSSKSFLENLDLEYLKEEELILLHKSLEYTNTLYSNYIIKTNKEVYKENLTLQKNILKRIKYINKYYKGKIYSKIHFIRKEQDRIGHMNKLPIYLEKVNKLIRKKIKKQE